MNYQQAYDFLISLNNLPRREYMTDPRHCSLYLKRLQFFLDILGNPEKKIPRYIHVTGTSGKGSICLMLSYILQASGKKVGVLTSPHPSVITERWEINNRPMSKKDFAATVEELKPKLDQYIKTTPYDMLSYSEISTAVSLYYFAKQKVDWAVLEAGCGGRYDSTNVIPRKDIAVITNIGLDHMGVIGATKQEIAVEKSGIIKKGCQVFTMEKNPKILKIIQDEADKNKAALNRIKNSGYKILKEDLDGIEFEFKGEKYSLPVLGRHQIANALLAIAVAEKINLPLRAIQKGLKNLSLPIRMEVISRRPFIILDGAHNPDKIKTAVETIFNFENEKFKNLHLVLGFSENKQIAKMAKIIGKLKPKSVFFTRFGNNVFRKTANPADLAKKFAKTLPKETKIDLSLDSRKAIETVKKNASENDLILVTGSIFLSGEIREALKK